MKETLGLNGKIHVVIESPQDRKYFSNRLAFLKAIEVQIAHSTEYSTVSRELDWVFFFEDDIKLHESFQSPKQAMQTIITGMKLATNGMVFLGICGMHWNDDTIITINSNQYRNCTGYCAHAFGIARWKLQSFLDYITPFKYQVSAFDMVLLRYASNHPMVLVGSNLTSPENSEHIGMFYQNRLKFNSTISLP